MKIKDSGRRVKFDTGASKDIVRGRGRYDLLPLETLSIIYKHREEEDTAEFLNHIYKSLIKPEIEEKAIELNKALQAYVEYTIKTNFNNVVPVIALLFEKGAEKYEERDWEKGRPMIVYINSILRHFFQFKNGETDEDHEAAVIWNLITCIDTIRRMPSLAYTLDEKTD